MSNLLDTILGSMARKPSQPQPAQQPAGATGVVGAPPRPAVSKYAINPALLLSKSVSSVAIPARSPGATASASAPTSPLLQQQQTTTTTTTTLPPRQPQQQPPAVDARASAASQAAIAMAERFRLEQEAIVRKEKEQRQAFHDKMTADLARFVQDKEQRSLTLPPMENLKRAIVHTVADELGLVSHAFGEEGVDRHVVVFHAETAPTADEIEQLKDPEGYQKRKEALAKLEDEAKLPRQRRKRPAAALDQDLIKEVQVQKRDLRSIEELQAVVRAQRTAKRVRLEGEEEEEAEAEAEADADQSGDDTAADA